MQGKFEPIDLSYFLTQQKFLKFDYLLATLNKSDDGKWIKAPIKDAAGFTNKDEVIHTRPGFQKHIKDNKTSYPLIGLILKNDVGLTILQKKVIVLDIDCKQDRDRGKVIFNEVLDYLVNTIGLNRDSLLSVSEMTISGGYHIFLTSDNIYPQKKLKIENGIEIEVFSSNRYIATAPSSGYTPLKSDYNCIDLSKTTETYVSAIALDSLCGHFSTELDNEEHESNVSDSSINEEFIFDTANFIKLTKTWDAFNRFMNGESDRDWDNVCDAGSSYDYIRHNIMPIMTLFGKTDDFLEKITDYGQAYAKQWSNYPQNWKDAYDRGKLILGKDARLRLKKLGFFKQRKESMRENLIKDFVEVQMLDLFAHVMLVHQGIYYYNKMYKCYTYLEKNIFTNMVGVHYKENLSIILTPEQYDTLYNTFVIYAEMFAVNESYKGYMSYDILRDDTYREKIPIVFKNGTAYMTDGGVNFFPDLFDPHDKALFCIQLDYSEDLLVQDDESIVYEWFKTKFNPQDLEFIQMFFGNLLVPSYNPSVMLVLYSYKGALGKSTLAKTLSSLFDIGSRSLITALPVSKLSNRFGGTTLTKALLNLTTELDDRIDSESFKSVISRERWEVEAKFENARYEVPLAKHISMANDVPKISADGGVMRRLAVFELNEQRAREDLEAMEYERLFIEDAKSLATFMILGLMHLRGLKFCDLSNLYTERFKDKVKKMREYNSNVFEWLGYEGAAMIRDKKEHGMTIEDAFSCYKTWCSNNDNVPVKLRTAIKYIMSAETITIGESGTKLFYKNV